MLTGDGIAAMAAIAWHNHSPWQVATMTAVRSGADDYVQGLARLGIACRAMRFLKSALRPSRRTLNNRVFWRAPP
jgi:hypothetical protein